MGDNPSFKESNDCLGSDGLLKMGPTLVYGGGIRWDLWEFLVIWF